MVPFPQFVTWFLFCSFLSMWNGLIITFVQLLHVKLDGFTFLMLTLLWLLFLRHVFKYLLCILTGRAIFRFNRHRGSLHSLPCWGYGLQLFASLEDHSSELWGRLEVATDDWFALGKTFAIDSDWLRLTKMEPQDLLLQYQCSFSAGSGRLLGICPASDPASAGSDHCIVLFVGAENFHYRIWVEAFEGCFWNCTLLDWQLERRS